MCSDVCQNCKDLSIQMHLLFKAVKDCLKLSIKLKERYKVSIMLRVLRPMVNISHNTAHGTCYVTACERALDIDIGRKVGLNIML